jgi:glycine/D-amino acid oxidase-like deaminating enzyme
MDGGYTVSFGDIISEIVPDSFRYFGQFFPVLRSEWNRLSLRFGKSFFEQWHMSRPWQNDAKSPFESVRVLDPKPDRKSVEKGRANLEKIFPVFKGAQVEESWAGYIDVTPDVIPIISAVDMIPGLYLSTGYSGHGFGIGPGAGHLTADLVTGANPIVDPTPYRFSRFSA